MGFAMPEKSANLKHRELSGELLDAGSRVLSRAFRVTPTLTSPTRRLAPTACPVCPLRCDPMNADTPRFPATRAAGALQNDAHLHSGYRTRDTGQGRVMITYPRSLCGSRVSAGAPIATSCARGSLPGRLIAIFSSDPVFLSQREGGRGDAGQRVLRPAGDETGGVASPVRSLIEVAWPSRPWLLWHRFSAACRINAGHVQALACDRIKQN